MILNFLFDRSRILTTSTLIVATTAMPYLLPAANEARRPNIVVAEADDWGWGHAGFLGDDVIKTPNIDRLASEGLILNRSYCVAPSCTASRASLLTGQVFYRLGAAAQLHGPLSKDIQSYPEILQKAGYAVGLVGKGLGPGDPRNGGREINPAGPEVASLDALLESRTAGQPFCFWFGSNNPHRPYNQKAIPRPDQDKVHVPPFLPDSPEVRADLADYYAEVQAFDSEVGALIDTLKKHGELENTLILVTSDNGMPFPRAKLNMHDSGTRMPTVLRWHGVIAPGRVYDGFVSQTDFAPTFLEAAGLPVPPEMTGRSLMPILTGKTDHRPGDDFVVVGRERHAAEYPSRGIHTKDFLLIRNYSPELSPAACDPGPTLNFMTSHRESPIVQRAWALYSSKRPSVELFDKRKDPDQLQSVADDPAYAGVLKELTLKLDNYLVQTSDPRASGEGDIFLSYPDFSKRKASAPAPQTP